jgi:hypothetical protein
MFQKHMIAKRRPGQISLLQNKQLAMSEGGGFLEQQARPQSSPLLRPRPAARHLCLSPQKAKKAKKGQWCSLNSREVVGQSRDVVFCIL